MRKLIRQTAIIALVFSAFMSTFAHSQDQTAPQIRTYKMGYPRFGNPEWIVNQALSLRMAWSPSPDDTEASQNWYLRKSTDGKEIALPNFVAIITEEGRDYGVFGIEGMKFPDGVYDLCHRTSAGVVQCEPHSVASRSASTDNFDFGVIADVHLNDPRGESRHKGVSAETIYRRALEEMNRRKVAFILVLGDLASMPPKIEKEFQTVRDVTIASSVVPVYFVPGNHDGITSMRGDVVKSDDLITWKRYFNAGSVSFDFGDFHFVGVNTYDRPAKERNLFGGVPDIDGGGISETQLSWFEQDVAQAQGKSLVVFAHHNPFETNHDPSGGGFRISVFTPYGRDRFLELLKKDKAVALFVGHTHKSFEKEEDGIKVISTTSLTSFTDGNQPNAMRIVHVKKGKIESSEIIPSNIAP